MIVSAPTCTLATYLSWPTNEASTRSQMAEYLLELQDGLQHPIQSGLKYSVLEQQNDLKEIDQCEHQ